MQTKRWHLFFGATEGIVALGLSIGMFWSNLRDNGPTRVPVDMIILCGLAMGFAVGGFRTGGVIGRIAGVFAACIVSLGLVAYLMRHPSF